MIHIALYKLISLINMCLAVFIHYYLLKGPIPKPSHTGGLDFTYEFWGDTIQSLIMSICVVYSSGLLCIVLCEHSSTHLSVNFCIHVCWVSKWEPNYCS